MGEELTISVEAAHAPTVLRAYARALRKAGEMDQAAEVFQQAHARDEALSVAEVDRRISHVVDSLGVTSEKVQEVMEMRSKGQNITKGSEEEKIGMLLSGR